MSFFHDEEDVAPEPIKGLPEALPNGEKVIWQGAPTPLALAIHAFHIRVVWLYYAAALTWRCSSLAAGGADFSAYAQAFVVLGGSAIALTAVLYGLAFVMARSAVYTITNKRIVLRYGAAIRKYINLPFASIAAVSMRRHGAKAGSIAIATNDKTQVPYLHLWPHARPLKFRPTFPMLRALPDVDKAVSALKSAMKKPASIMTEDDYAKSETSTAAPQHAVTA